MSGGLIATAGCVCVSFFLVDAVGSVAPVYWVLQAYPTALSAALVAVGVLLARGHLVPDRCLRRLLAWMAVGVVVFSLFLAWFYGLAVVVNSRPLLDPPVAVVTLPTLGALVGLLVGTYDARATEGKRVVGRLSETNETLRIATSELVERTDRDTLERAVCERLVESHSFDAAWIGRYDPEDGYVRPVAWAGIDDDAVGSLVVPVDGDRTDGSVWSRVLDTGAGPFLPDGLGNGTVGSREDALERCGAESMAVVPIVGSDRVYGLVGIRADRRNAFDEFQRGVFGELGETVGHAIDSIRAHDTLEARERELVKQNDRLDEFVGVVSHDLRNPLNVVLGQVATMKETTEGEEEGLDTIERSGRRMEEIITDLLALSRASRVGVETEPVRLAVVTAESWRNVETDGAEFDMQVPETATVRADPARLRTVFENLFRNAIEHNEAPLAVRVGVVETAAPTDDGGSLVGVFVEDDGDGVPADERDAIFDHGYTTNDDGTGFGLSIVREVVDAHGWDIAFREGRDGGARVEITGVSFDE